MPEKKSTKKLLLAITALIIAFVFLSPALLNAAIPSCQKSSNPTESGFEYPSVKCLLDLLAQEAGYPYQDETGEPERIVEILGSIFGLVLGLLGVLFVVLIIYAGILWMTAGGNEEQIKKATGILKDAIIGLLIITAAALIMYLVVDLLLPDTAPPISP